MGRTSSVNSFRPSHAAFVIPQEIVSLIIDEVAFQLHTSPEARKTTLATLRACSLVSNSFYQQARRHLFSEIHFLVDNRSRKYTSGLRSLGVGERDGLVNAIRSLTLTVDLLSTKKKSIIRRIGFTNAYTSSWENILRFFDSLKLRHTDVVAVIDALNTACLENLEVVGKRSFHAWNSGDKVNSALSRVCTNDTLESLRLDRVLAVPQALLTDAIGSNHLYNLHLSKISIARTANHETSHREHASFPRTSSLQQLEATGFPCATLFNILRSNDHTDSLSTPRYLAFPHLRSLTMSVPTLPSEMDELWHFLQHVSQSLESLELQQYKWSMNDVLSQGPIRLSSLTSLRNLKLTTTSFDTNKNFSSKQEMVARFLASDSLASQITSITIDLYVHRNLKQKQKDRNMSWKDLGPHSGWAAIDSALSTPAFPNLRQVVLNVKLFYFVKGSHHIRLQHEMAISAHNLLPSLASMSSMSSIATDISLYTICSPQSFLDHFNVL